MTRCPECGSENVDPYDDEHFKCLDCRHHFTKEEVEEAEECRDGDKEDDEERERQENRDTDFDEEEDQTGDDVGDPDDGDILFC